MKRLLVCSILIASGCGCGGPMPDTVAAKRNAYMACLKDNITRPTAEAKSLCEPLLK